MSRSSGTNSSVSDSEEVTLCEYEYGSSIELLSSCEVEGSQVSQGSRAQPVVQVLNFGGPVVGSEPQQGFKFEKNPKSTLSLDKLQTIRNDYGISDQVYLVSPFRLERPHWVYPGWSVMYKILFSYGARLPLPRLVLEACHCHHIAPSQLAPNAWRILMAIQVLTENRGVHFTYHDVSYAYSLQTHRNDTGRFLLVNRFDVPLIQRPPDSYKKWARHYFLVPSNTLNVSSDYNIPDSWSHPEKVVKNFCVQSESTTAKISWFLNIPIEERSVNIILTEENIENSSLQGHKSPDVIMSRRIDLPLLGKNQLVEMARQHKKKKSKAVVGSSGEDAQAAVDVAPPPPPTFSRSKKRDASIDLTSLSDQTTLTFPSSACAHSDFGPISSEAQKLLFEEDQLVLQRMGTRSVAIAHYQAAFTEMQKAAYLLNSVEESSKRDNDHKAERGRWMAERNALTSSMESSSQTITRLEAEIRAKGQAATKAAEMHEEELREKMEAVRFETQVKTYAAAAAAYEACYPKPWDVGEYKAAYELVFGRTGEEEDAPTDDAAGGHAGGDDPSPPVDD